MSDAPQVAGNIDVNKQAAPSRTHFNRYGGAIAGLLEFAAFTTLWRELDDESVVVKPITVTVDYMRGGTNHDTFASATVERLGSRIANVEAFAWQKNRATPIASAQLNFLLDRGQ